MERAVLALDTASPEVSVAVADLDGVMAVRCLPQRSASAGLVAALDEVLAEAGETLTTVAGVVALRGPGSFTGLRVGLATALGIHQATGHPATALSTLFALALSAPPGASTALAAVHALRDEWFVQRFRIGSDELPAADGSPWRAAGDEAAAAARAVEVVVGFPAGPQEGLFGRCWHRPVNLAGTLAAWCARHPPAWDTETLSRPLYLAPAPATLPSAPKAVRPR